MGEYSVRRSGMSAHHVICHWMKQNPLARRLVSPPRLDHVACTSSKRVLSTVALHGIRRMWLAVRTPGTQVCRQLATPCQRDSLQGALCIAEEQTVSMHRCSPSRVSVG